MQELQRKTVSMHDNIYIELTDDRKLTQSVNIEVKEKVHMYNLLNSNDSRK